MVRHYTTTLALVALFLAGSASAFYLPGVAPQDFAKVSQITFFIAKVVVGRNLLFISAFFFI
jgi:hypothetical protein